jgi:hypothetical protein
MPDATYGGGYRLASAANYNILGGTNSFGNGNGQGPNVPANQIFMGQIVLNEQAAVVRTISITDGTTTSILWKGTAAAINVYQVAIGAVIGPGNRIIVDGNSNTESLWITGAFFFC